jgi:phage repressor protein C with HTH and peptisase S24 domain
MNEIERIQNVIDYTGLSARKLAGYIGLSSPQIFYDIKKGKCGISKDLANKIHEKYLNISRSWLLTGDGQMFNNTIETSVVNLNSEHRGAPVYNIDATCGAEVRDFYLTDERIVGYVDLPEIRPNTHIIRANGDSMQPVINDGNLVALREVSSWDTVFYGQIYLVILEDYRMLKYIRRYEADEQNYVILRSENTNYDDMIVSKKKILKLFIVENILSVKVQL